MRNLSVISFITVGFLGISWAACSAGGYTETSTTVSQTASTGSAGNGGAGGAGGAGGEQSSGNGFANSSSSGMEGCDPESFTLEQAPAPEVYLVIDRSGSMNEPGASMNKSKWDELKGAIDTALSQFENQIHFGVLLYPTGAECSTSGPQVGFEATNHDAIMDELNSASPAGGTPTAAALNNAAASIADFGDPQTTKFLVLATDGGPNCNYLLNPSNGCSCTQAAPPYCCTNHPASCVYGSSCLDDQNTLDTIKTLKSNNGIDTFVIGLAGTDEYKDLLNEMAKDGGQPQMGASTDYYAVTDQMSLLNALKQIAGSVISCQIELSEAPAFPEEVKVYVDGQEVPRDESKMNGWDYTDNSNKTIELYGPACDKIQDGNDHDITATFECKNQ